MHGQSWTVQIQAFFYSLLEIEKLKSKGKIIDSSVNDSITLALPKNLPKESIQESRIPRIVPPLAPTHTHIIFHLYAGCSVVLQGHISETPMTTGARFTNC
jgi:hypothetical protein